MDAEERAAVELRDWFNGVLSLCDRTVFAVATREPHRQAAVLSVLTRNAKAIVHGELDRGGALYTPLCFVLAAACRRLDLAPGEREWLSAIKNVHRLEGQLREVGEASAWPVGTPASIFKQHLDEALVNAGVTDRPTILDHHNRQLALGLAANWGLRFLVAYAMETPSRPGAPTEAQDLAWVRRAVAQAGKAA
ncbi:MAG: hypothetical protein HY909_15700 [Deltaproteobacteria bacterium]|nr:hypothetical protein [Deltaproteobacteria bacterium]